MSLLYPRVSETRRVVSLDGFWKFKLDPQKEGLAAGWTAGLKDAVSMPVPASFNDIFTDKDIREYCGDFWYETDVFVPGEWEGKEIVVRFGSGSQSAVVYMNGIEVASHLGGYLPFNAVVTDEVKYNAYNKLSVLLNNELSETNIPVGKTNVLSNGKMVNAPYFDFFSYAGLQRPVKLLAIPREAVTDYATTYEICGEDAKVNYTIATNGAHEVKVALYDAEGNQVAASIGKKGTLEVKKAKLWNVGAAYLYRIEIRIVDGPLLLDSYSDTIGIRTFEVKDGSFLLNGSPVYLRGFGRHEDSNVRGKGFDPVLNKRDYELMKWIGANSYRTSHYPYAEEMYYEADEEGFLIIDEVPAVGLMESTTNFLAANQGNGKKVGFFEKETTPQLLKNHLAQVEEMITRDKNHPSVIAWSLLNEPQCTSDGTEEYFKQVFDYAHALDPQKRPRTYAIVMMSLPNTSKGQQFADFLSLNRYYGWYVMGGNAIADAEAGFRKEMDGWAEKMNGRPMIFTEYGADTLGSEHKLPSVMWAQEYQEEYLEMNNRVFDSYPFVKGEQVWNFADFQTTEGIMRVNGNKKGIFTRDRQPKQVAYKFRERWTGLPVDYKG